MRVIVFHGICDTIVHPINGQQVITQWAQTNFLVDGGIGQADVTPALVQSDIINGKSYTQQIYHDGDGEPQLELWMIDQMGHAWSGGSPNGSFTDSSGPNATEIIWNFLSNNQQQPEEKQIETQVHKPLLAQVEPEDHQPTQTPTETEAELPIESPKKNFFSRFLTKLMKKKK